MKSILLFVTIIFPVTLFSQEPPQYWEANGWYFYRFWASSFDTSAINTEIVDSNSSHGLHSQLFNSEGIPYHYHGSTFPFLTDWYKVVEETPVPDKILVDYYIISASEDQPFIDVTIGYGGTGGHAEFSYGIPNTTGIWQTVVFYTNSSFLSSFRNMNMEFGYCCLDSVTEVSFSLLVDNLRLVYDDNTIIYDSFGDSIVVDVVDEYFREISSEFYLLQNYPNPFNPTTTIRYSIPNFVNSTEERNLRDFSSSSTPRNDNYFVQLKVYDVLGREILTLVNEEKLPGTYEVIFDGNNLSSGVYFYTLTAGDFVETKKLMLMK